MILVIGTLALSGVLTSSIFHGNELLVIWLAVGLIGFYAMHMTRGTLAGNGRFGPYGELLAVEGVARLVGAVALVAGGVPTPAPTACASRWPRSSPWGSS